MKEQLTLFPEDFLANPTARQVSDLEKKITDISGRKCLEQYGKLNHDGLWAKTFSALLIGMKGWSSKRCRLTWNLKGTKYKRMYFQLQVSMHPTKDTELGLLLTPTTVMTDEHPAKMRDRAKKNGYQNGTKYGSLLSQVKYSGLLPTPTTQEPSSECELTETGRRKTKDGKDSHSLNIGRMAAMGLLPTPNASDHPGKNTGKRNQDSLPKRIREAGGKTSQLNPRFVAEMMGFPTDWTELPFQNGETNQ